MAASIHREEVSVRHLLDEYRILPSANGRTILRGMIERVVYCSSLEVQRNAASPSLSEAIKRLLEAEKRAHKAMLLRVFDCVEAVVNQATKAMLLATTAALQPVLPASLINSQVLSPALWLLPFRKPLPRRRGRPPENRDSPQP